MKHRKTLRFAVLTSALFWISTSLYSQVLNLTVKDIDGNVSTLAKQSDAEILVLDFWATWCKPCVKSIPKIVALSEKYKDKDVVFIGVNEDSPRNLMKVKPMARNLGITYPVVLDTEQSIMTNLLVSAFPTLIIIDRNEKVLFTHEGFVSGDEEIIEKELEKILSHE